MLDKQNITIVMSEKVDPSDCQYYVDRMVNWLSSDDTHDLKIQTKVFPFSHHGQKCECVGKLTNDKRGIIFVGTEVETNRFDSTEYKKYL